MLHFMYNILPTNKLHEVCSDKYSTKMCFENYKESLIFKKKIFNPKARLLFRKTLSIEAILITYKM